MGNRSDVGTVVVKYVIVMDVLDFNSMINHSIRKIICIKYLNINVW